MNKFLDWFNFNRKTIGYVVGVLCLTAAISDIAVGNAVLGVLWLLVGGMIIIDAKQM